jgi:hypothetical protein
VFAILDKGQRPETQEYQHLGESATVVSDARAHAEEERLYHFSLEHITKL